MSQVFNKEIKKENIDTENRLLQNFFFLNKHTILEFRTLVNAHTVKNVGLTEKNKILKMKDNSTGKNVTAFE